MCAEGWEQTTPQPPPWQERWKYYVLLFEFGKEKGMMWLEKCAFMKKLQRKYTALFVREKDGGFSVSIPELPGCFSEGDSYEEASENIHEAIELYLEDVTPQEAELFAPYQSDELFLTRV